MLTMQQIQTIIIISSLTFTKRCIPETLYTFFRVRSVCSQRRLCIRSNHSYRMQCRLFNHRTVNLVYFKFFIFVRFTEEFLHFVIIFNVPLICCKPLVIKTNVCNNTVGIAVIPVVASTEDILLFLVWCSIIVSILSSQSGVFMTRFFKYSRLPLLPFSRMDGLLHLPTY